MMAMWLAAAVCTTLACSTDATPNAPANGTMRDRANLARTHLNELLCH